MIITGFLLLLFVIVPPSRAWTSTTQIGNVINRFSWNAVLVLAMVPMIHSGCSLNFGTAPRVSCPACWARRCPSSWASRGR